MADQKDYDSSSIQVLEGLEPVRKRPGMYVGGTDVAAMHHCLWEIIDNSVDEAMAGYCENIDITIYKDGSASIQDDGRGIPVSIHPKLGIPTSTVVFTVLHAGGKFDGGAYKVSGGLHGVGASVTNALSTRLSVLIKREGKKWEQEFENGGEIKVDLHETGTTNRTGTYVRFWPDMTIFDAGSQWERERIIARIKTTAFLNPGLNLSLKFDGIDEEALTFKADSFAEILDDICKKSGAAVCETIQSVSTEEVEGEGDVEVNLAFRWHERNSVIIGFANTIPTGDGQHISGIKSATTRAINNFASTNNLVKKGQTFTSDDVHSSLIAAVSVKLPEPKFAGQTKDKLTNPGVSGVVSRATNAAIQRVFEEFPQQAKSIIERIKIAQRAREAADKARDTIIERKSVISPTALPGKLADCQSKDPAISEVFIVEGDSAGGSAKQGREREYQAILPLKGKILNTYQATQQKTLSSEEVKNMILAFGCGIGKHFNYEKLRYGKIVILSDADSDGAHISTLALTFIHSYLPQLIENGNVYIALPPLFRAKKNKDSYYLKDQAELDAFLAKQKDPEKWSIQRFKGLGEMNPEQLWEAAMNPETRRLGKLSYSTDGRDHDNQVFELLMGKDVPPRRQFIEQKSNLATVDL